VQEDGYNLCRGAAALFTGMAKAMGQQLPAVTMPGK
jgi:hypothetical protein